MSKIIFWLVIFFVGLFVLRLVNIAKSRRNDPAQPRSPDKKAAGAMVRCTQCGVFLPKADALPSPQGFRCGDPACAQRHGNAR